jgi:hydrogenase maturation protease
MKTLIIGYGNSLRGDDGVGALVAEQVAAWNLPEVRTLSVHQLTPELAAEIAEVEIVFFADACIGRLHATIEPIQLAAVPCLQKGSNIGLDIGLESLNHVWNPAVLLALAKTLYNAVPVAYQLLIPAHDFGYGAPLSKSARDGLAWSLQALQRYFTHSRSNQLEVLPCMKLA